MHPVFDLPFAAFDRVFGSGRGCFRGRPRGRFAGIGRDTRVKVAGTSFTSGGIPVCSTGSGFGSRSFPSCIRSPFRSSSSMNPDVAHVSVPNDDTADVKTVVANDDDLSDLPILPYLRSIACVSPFSLFAISLVLLPTYLGVVVVRRNFLPGIIPSPLFQAIDFARLSRYFNSFQSSTDEHADPQIS